MDAEVAGRTLFNPVLAYTQSTSVFLENGGRLYLDVGSHPEYATAECRDLGDVLAQDRAGTKILVGMAESASQEISQKTGLPTRVHLFKNNLDSVGHSCGCHENYLLYRTGKFRALVESLVSFLVTRQVITGAGVLLKIKGHNEFCLSQRAFQIDDTVSAATTSTRPLVNTRDEPHADAKRYRRLHVIVGDSNILEHPTRFKIATMNLLLAALEAGADFSDLALENPISALRDITRFEGFSLPLPLAQGGEWTALQLQMEFQNRLQSVFYDDALPLEYQQILADWQCWLAKLKAQDFFDLAGVLDWPTKLLLLERLKKRSNLDWGDAKLARLDLAYHDVVAPLDLERRGLAQRLTTAAQVEHAVHTAPSNTRAALRGRFIAQAKARRVDMQVDWTHLRLTESGLPTVTLSDPFATTCQKAAKLMETMETR